jgi:hypothetical protein
MWFEKLTGFREETPDQVRTNMKLEGSTITSRVNGRSMDAGRLETPTLDQLRKITFAETADTGQLTIEEIVGDVQSLHADPHAEGALFQVASQFNLLEMVGPSVTPEQGISIYANDPTQGPACAIAAGAGTIYRNYFAAVNGQTGQSADNQIDCLRTIGDALENRNEQLWMMRNGYVIPTESGLREITDRLTGMEDAERDAIRGKLRIGLQWDTEVTLDGSSHLITQAYCSALPVSYSLFPTESWEEFARLVLEGTYEATLAAAVYNYANTGNNKVYLTLVGGGAFGNRTDWILSAIGRALHIFNRHPLDVKIVSYGASNPRLGELF